MFSCPYNGHSTIILAFSQHRTQITAYILGALYFTAGGPSSLQYSGDNILFLQDVMATRVHINGDISSIGSGDISVKASDMGLLLQGGNYRNTPSGGMWVHKYMRCIFTVYLWSPINTCTLWFVAMSE